MGGQPRYVINNQKHNNQDEFMENHKKMRHYVLLVQRDLNKLKK